MLGTYIRGFEVAERSFAGGMFDWLTPFSLLTGVALVSGYALLGATWLIMKTTGPLQDRCFDWRAGCCSRFSCSSASSASGRR